jgi:hypothetical protein
MTSRISLGRCLAWGFDPDVVYFRDRQTLLSADQRALLIDLAHTCGFKATSDPPGWLDEAERSALHDFLTATPPVSRLDRYRFASTAASPTSPTLRSGNADTPTL